MDKEAMYYKHSICLIAVFLFGNLIIGFPKGEGAKQSLISVLVCFAIVFALSMLLSRFSRYNVLSLQITDSNIANMIFKIAFLLFSLLCLFITANDYILLIDKIRLPNTSAVVLSVIFILLALFLCKQNKKIIYVFSLFSFIFAVLSFIVIFIFSIPNINISLLKENFTFNFKSLATQSLYFCAHSLGQIIIAAVFIGKICDKSRARRTYLLGTFFGVGILLICVLNVVLVLGTDLIDELAYPYSTVTGIITLGSSYSRMDGFTYYIYFMSALIKASVILSVICEISQKILKKFSKIAVAVISVLAVAVAASEKANSFLQGRGVIIILLIFESLILLSLSLATFNKKLNNIRS